MMVFRQLFDSHSSAYTYVVADLSQKKAAIFDPVLKKLDRDLTIIRELGVELSYCFETHLHDDHVSAAAYLREAMGCQIAVPAASGILDADIFVADGDNFALGDINISVIDTAGHASAHCAYFINHDRLITGDSLTIRSCGHVTAADASAEALWESVHSQLFVLSGSTIVYPGHDFQGRTCSTIAEEREYNPRLALKSKQAFIQHMSCLDLPRFKDYKDIMEKNRHCGVSQMLEEAV
jgi:sulfur dioxygenase